MSMPFPPLSRTTYQDFLKIMTISWVKSKLALESVPFLSALLLQWA